MGNAHTQLNEVSQQRIQEIVQEVSNAFIAEFKMQYRSKLVQDTLNNSPIPYEKERQRIFDPVETVPHWMLIAGTLTKLGGRRRNWKERYVELGNQADNYDMIYYEKIDGNMKGDIKLCGYHVQPVDGSEDLGSPPGVKEYAFKLVPKRKGSKIRVWLMKSTSEEERNQWMGFLEDACHLAKPPLDADPYTASAFKEAFKLTRFRFGNFEKFFIDSSEPECLAVMMAQIIDDQLLKEVLKDRDARMEAHSAIEGAITVEVGALWDLLRSQTRSVREELQRSVLKRADVIIASDKAMRQRVNDALESSIIGPALEAVKTAVLPPVMKEFESILIDVYVTLHNSILSRVKYIEGIIVEQAVNDIMHEVTNPTSSLMAPVLASAKKIYDIINEVDTFFSYDYSSDDVFYDIIRAAYDVSLRALAGLKGKPFSQETVVPGEDFKQWSQKFGMACKFCCLFVTKDVLLRMVVNLPDWQTNVCNPAREYAKRLQEDMDALLEPSVAAVIQLPILVDASVKVSLDKLVFEYAKSQVLVKFEQKIELAADSDDEEAN